MVESISPDTVIGLLTQSVELVFRITEDVPRVQPQNITWSLNDTILLPSDTVVFSPDRQSVTLYDLMEEQEGEYTITVSNDIGVDSAYVYLDVESMNSCIVSINDVITISLMHLCFNYWWCFSLHSSSHSH